MTRSNRHQLPIAQSNPRSPISEAYRTIRTNIQFAGVVEDTKGILITSAQPGEGKTSTAANVAIVSAQAGHRVLLVDADLRKPQVHHRFNTSNLDGLSSVLIRERQLDECLVETSTPNLYVLPSGPIPPNPSEMLGSKAFRHLIDQCRKQFDYIFIDSPPVLSVTDALVLTGVVDGTIVVVHSRETNRNVANRAITALEQVHARILGVVLNRISKKSAKSYYAYNYYDAGQHVSF